MALASISYIFKVFIEGAVTFIEGAVTFIGGVLTFIGGAVTFVGKESSAVGGGSFETAGARAGAGVANDIEGADGRDSGRQKGVDRRNPRRWLIAYELKGPSLLIYSLISASNHSVRLSS